MIASRTRTLVTALLCASFSGALLAQVTPGKPMPPVVTVKVDTAGDLGQVSPQIFGSFIEPIDYSVNNGVMAEILVNGSLEAGLWNHAELEPIFKEQPELIDSTNNTGIPIPWQSLNRNAGNRFELHVGHAANSWQSLEVMGQPDELTGIKQRVYLPVQRELEYNVSLYARHIDGPTKLTVSIRSRATKNVLASATMDATAADWTKYKTSFTLKAGDVQRLEQVDFAVAVEGTERVELDEISLTPADAVDGFDADVLRMSEEMHMTELRFAGNFSSYYHWRDGVGDPDKRVTMENIAWGIPEYNNFGTDEFLDFCKRIHVEPQIGVNEGSGYPAEAVDWVKYIREKYKGPMIVEMGNELYGRWQVGYPTVNQVAARTLDFSKALKPLMGDNTTLLATGAGPGGAAKWNAQLFSLPPGSFDLLTVHFIVGTNHVMLKPYTPDFMAAAAYAVPYAVGADFDAMTEQREAIPGWKNSGQIAVTEWLFNSKGDGERNFTNESPSSRNQGGAVMVASSFNTYFRHNAQIKLVDMTGLLEFAGIWKRKEQVFASPPYYIFRMYSTAKGETVLPVSTDTGTYSVANGTPGFAKVADVPYIDIAATRSKDGKSVTLFCVNRSLTDDEPVKIDLGAFKAAGDVTVEQMVSANRYVINDEEDPHRVLPKTSTMAAPGGSSMQVTLPHESVTVLRLHAR